MKSVLAKAISLIVGAVAIAGICAIVLAVFGIPPIQGLKLLFEGALGDAAGRSQSIVKATPLLLTGLGVAVAWRAGAFSIGGEGQYVLGACGIALTSTWMVRAGGFWTSGWSIPLNLLVSSVFGGVWAYLAAWLYQRRSVQLVISTILLNFVALNLLSFLVQGPLKRPDGTMPQTVSLPKGMMLPKFDPKFDTHWGCVIALIVALAVWVWVSYSRFGFATRVVGSNPVFARTLGINPELWQSRAIVLSGMLCGLAGGIQILGMTGNVGESIAQNYGFLAIPVALVAFLNALALIPSALVFGGFFAATINLGRFVRSGSTVIYVIQAVTMLALLAFQAFQSRRREQSVALDDSPSGVSSA